MAQVAELTQLTDRQAAAPCAGPANRMMVITPGRVAYAGLLGQPKTREFGALTVYVSLGAPFQIQIDGGAWASADMVVVAPDTAHRITTSDRQIGVLLVELETVVVAGLPAWLQPGGPASQYDAGLAQARQAFLSLCSGTVDHAAVQNDFDVFFFGQPLAPRQLDARLARVVAKMRHDPCGLIGAEDCAKLAHLSFSRFRHLFKEELGTTFRSFRAWKRARSFLWHVHSTSSLTDVALDIGFPDSSHFSHTVLRYWGLTPKAIVAGSRRLAVIQHGEPALAG